MEYWIKFWSQQFKKEKELPERIQWRVTKQRTIKMIRVLELVSCNETLREMGLCSLEKTERGSYQCI